MSAPRTPAWRLRAGLLALASCCIASPAASRAEDQWVPVRAGERGELRVASRDVPAAGSVSTTGKLPNDAGQVWREYDIRTFTGRMQDQEKPEQAVVDWILRETGTDAWFGDPLSLLSVSRDVVRVYHTPQIQEIVASVVGRFVNTRSEAHEVVARLVTVDSPNWRLKALPVLHRPVPVQTLGVEAWLLSREDAALLLAELSKRTDYREHTSRQLSIYSGQTHTISSTRPRTFTGGVHTAASAAGAVATPSQIDEGFSLQISPLVTPDLRMMDAVVRCNVDQVERFTPLWMEAPDQFGGQQRLQIQVPQVSSWRLHERFRWPANEVILISRGLVATPGPATRWTGSLTRLFDGGAPRADALLFLESRDEVRSSARPQRMATGTPPANYRGRY